MSLGLLVFLPTTIFTVIMLFVTFFFHSLQPLVWVVVTLCVGLSVMFMVVRHSRDGPKYWFNLGALCFIAAVCGTFIGLWNYQRNMLVFYAYDGQRQYNNVLPGDPALQHLDAGQLYFSPDAHVDMTYVQTHTSAGVTYCVAPVVGQASQDYVEYWAAGENCCTGGHFTCGEASNSQIHAGLVYLDDESLPDNNRAKFKKAADKAQSVGVLASKDAFFVQWADPVQAKRQYWNYGVGYMAVSLIVYLVISVVVGLAVHFFRSPFRSNKDKLTARGFVDSSVGARYG